MMIREKAFQANQYNNTYHSTCCDCPKRDRLIKSITGQSYIPTYTEEFMKRPNGCPKMIVEYDTPVEIVWEGDIFEEKEIDVNPDSTIGVGQKKQLNASVRTKDWGSDTWGIWYDVKSRAIETTWISEDESIATVSSTGEVTGVSPGTVRPPVRFPHHGY
jgi:hypothetical protein